MGSLCSVIMVDSLVKPCCLNVLPCVAVLSPPKSPPPESPAEQPLSASSSSSVEVVPAQLEEEDEQDEEEESEKRSLVQERMDSLRPSE